MGNVQSQIVRDHENEQIVSTSLNIRINRMNDVISLSSPVIASTPGSIRLRNESKSFKILDTSNEKQNPSTK